MSGGVGRDRSTGPLWYSQVPLGSDPLGPASRHERGSRHEAPRSCSSQSCVGRRMRLLPPPQGRSRSSWRERRVGRPGSSLLVSLRQRDSLIKAAHTSAIGTVGPPVLRRRTRIGVWGTATLGTSRYAATAERESSIAREVQSAEASGMGIARFCLFTAGCRLG
jgi:hypothetical protein